MLLGVRWAPPNRPNKASFAVVEEVSILGKAGLRGAARGLK